MKSSWTLSSVRKKLDKINLTLIQKCRGFVGHRDNPLEDIETPRVDSLEWVIELDGQFVRDRSAGYGYRKVIAPIFDGEELYFGTNLDKKASYTRKEIRHIFWWLVWDWFIVSSWLGLRRPIYRYLTFVEEIVFEKLNPAFDTGPHLHFEIFDETADYKFTEETFRQANHRGQDYEWGQRNGEA